MFFFSPTVSFHAGPREENFPNISKIRFFGHKIRTVLHEFGEKARSFWWWRRLRGSLRINSLCFFFPPEFFFGESAVLCFLLYYEKFCLDRQRFFPLSSSLAKDTKKKNKVSAHAAAAKYNLWRPTDTKIHHDLELSYSPYTAVFRQHECRTVAWPISTKGTQRQ